MQKQYIPSKITPGKHFSIDVYKPGAGRRPYVYVTEGKLTIRESGMTSFEYTMPGARHDRLELRGNNTAKNRKEAVLALLGKLVDAGWIYPGEEVNSN